jgi:hypothetical protein
VLSLALLQQHGPVKKVADLSRFPIIHQWDREEWNAWLRLAGSKGMGFAHETIMRDSNHALQAAIEGQGVILGTFPLVQNDIASGQLVQLFPIELQPPRAYHLLTRPGSRADDRVPAVFGRLVMEAALPGGNQDTIAGRFALSARGAPGARALDLELVSPFGQTVATGRRESDGRAMLTLSDGRTLRAASLDALLEQALGWPLPIERLPDWLDDRFETVVTRDAAGRVATAEDSGWRIEREPRRWTLRRPHEGTQLRVGLVLDR